MGCDHIPGTEIGPNFFSALMARKYSSDTSSWSTASSLATFSHLCFICEFSLDSRIIVIICGIVQSKMHKTQHRLQINLQNKTVKT